MSDGRRRISLRWSLLRSFILLIFLSSLIVLALTWIRSLDTEKRLSKRLLGQGTRQMRQELDRFLVPAIAGTRMGRAWGRGGNLDLTLVTTGEAGTTTAEQMQEASRLNSLLLPYVIEHPAVSSVQVANDRGEGFLVLQGPGDRIRNRIVSPEAWGDQTLWFELDRDGVPTSHEWKAFPYEARKRPWFIRALAAEEGEVVWTDPYSFATTGDIGITTSSRWVRNGSVCVIALDVLLTALSDFTQAPENQISPNALMLVADEQWRVLGVPRCPTSTDEVAVKKRLLKPISELRTREVVSARSSHELDRDRVAQVYPFEHDGDGWWAQISPYRLGDARRLHMVLLVPNRDLLQDVAEQRVFLLIATVVALLAAILYSWWMARSYSRPLEALAVQSRRVRDLEFSHSEVVDANLREFQDLAQAQQQALAALQSFSRYVPIDVVKDLVAAGEVARIGGRVEELTVLFTDIAGFTTISEGMEPQALTDHMAQYFQAMIDTIQAHSGTVDKLVGDAIVAFWGAPRKLERHTEAGVRAILACRDELDRLNAAWVAQGMPALPTRFGLSTGPVVVGNIGAHSRLAYTVLGDTVNFAARLEGLNKVYGTTLLADAAVKDACGEDFVWRALDRTIVKGKTEAVRIYELLGEAGGMTPEMTAAARRYEEAWALYAERRFHEAATILRDRLRASPADAASSRLLALCERYLEAPPSDDFDGTTRMTTK